MSKSNTLGERYDPHLPATKIIAKWGSNARFAKALGRSHSTTARWLTGGHIPGEYHAEVHTAARGDSIRLSPEDFVDLRLWQLEDQSAALAALSA